MVVYDETLPNPPDAENAIDAKTQIETLGWLSKKSYTDGVDIKKQIETAMRQKTEDGDEKSSKSDEKDQKSAAKTSNNILAGNILFPKCKNISDFESY